MNHKAEFFVADYSDTTHVYIHLQAASEEVITDVAYAKSRREFAYSSADKLIYIRKFATSVKSWNLLHVLQGMHFSNLVLSHIIFTGFLQLKQVLILLHVGRTRERGIARGLERLVLDVGVRK